MMMKKVQPANAMSNFSTPPQKKNIDDSLR